MFLHIDWLGYEILFNNKIWLWVIIVVNSCYHGYCAVMAVTVHEIPSPTTPIFRMIELEVKLRSYTIISKFLTMPELACPSVTLLNWVDDGKPCVNNIYITHILDYVVRCDSTAKLWVVFKLYLV